MAAQILIAHWNAQELEGLVNFFKEQSIEVIPAANGQEAYDTLMNASRTPDVVVLCADLREKPPAEVVKEIKQQERFQNVPFLITIPDEFEAAPFEELGVKEFIDEPYVKDRLLRKINVILDYGSTKKTEKKGIAKFLPFIIVGVVILLFVFWLISIMPTR